MVVAFGNGSVMGGLGAFGPAQAVQAQRVAPVARSAAALLLACGAKPHELDGVMQVLIEHEQNGAPVPRSYEEMALVTIEAIVAYREAMAKVVEADPEPALPSENG